MAQILVIDDEGAVRKMLRRLLEHLGHDVVEACDGGEGIQLFQQGGIDLIISDIVMPQSGLDVIRQVRQTDSDVSIIAITDYDIAALEMAKELGADYIFEKPLHIQDVMETVEDLLKSY